MDTSQWLLLQLADGSFPSGAFAHSAGLEAAMVLGGLEDGSGGERDPLEGFLDASLRQVGASALPFVRAATLEPCRLGELDELCDATLSLQAPNRASRAQGRALASAARRVWDTLGPVAEHVARGPAHHAPVFGAIFGTLGLSSDDTLAAYLHGSARALLSAAVRLGLAGPLEAQRMLAERASLLQAIHARARERRPEDAAMTAPRIELFAALHDHLDGRMFQS